MREINLRHAKAAALLLALDNHVDEQMEQRQYILPLQISPAFGLFHQQQQLLEGERGRVGVNGGDRSGVAAVDVAKIEESRAIAQFLQQYAIGPHMQAGLEQMLGPDLGLPLSVLGIAKMDGVAVGAAQFARFLYRRSEEHTSELQSL